MVHLHISICLSISLYVQGHLFGLLLLKLMKKNSKCMLLILSLCLVAGVYFGSAVFLVSTVCVCSGDKPINHSNLIGPRYHLSDYCILLTLRDTISYPWLFTPPTHSAFHCCSAHASQMKAMLHSVNNTEWMRDWHSFIIVKWIVVGGRQGCLVRKEMSCYPVMTMLVREHPWQHQRASNYNQFPTKTTSKT